MLVSVYGDNDVVYYCSLIIVSCKRMRVIHSAGGNTIGGKCRAAAVRHADCYRFIPNNRNRSTHFMLYTARKIAEQGSFKIQRS